MNGFFIVPLVLFFTAYYSFGIYVATGVLMVSTTLESIYHYYRHKKLDRMRQFTLVAILLLGGATIFFQNADFIKWKPTVIYWICAVAFGVTHWFTQKTLAERLFANLFRQALESDADLPVHIWRPVNLAWFLFSLSLGFLNIIVAYQFTLDQWVNFKVFGITVLTFAFTIGQGMYIFKFAKSATEQS